MVVYVGYVAGDPPQRAGREPLTKDDLAVRAETFIHATLCADAEPIASDLLGGHVRASSPDIRDIEPQSRDIRRSVIRACFCRLMKCLVDDPCFSFPAVAGMARKRPHWAGAKGTNAMRRSCWNPTSPLDNCTPHAIGGR